MKRIGIYIMICLWVTLARAQGIAGYEYWFDNYFDNRASVEAASGDIALTLDVSDLGEGIHYLNFRAKDNAGLWSSPLSHYFFRAGADHSLNQLKKYEYWLDNHFTDRKLNDYPTDNNGVLSTEIDVSALKPGVHYINLRIQDTFGVWSNPVSHYFYRAGADHSQNQMANCEYWLDNHYDQRTKANIGTDGTLTLNEFNVSALTEGAHYFNFRAQDSFGSWSNPVAYYFYRLAHHIPLKNLITHYRYMFNNDKNTERLIELDPPVNPLEWKDMMIEIPEIPITQIPDSFGLEPGTITGQVSLDIPTNVQFILQFKDSTEQWSNPVVHNFKHHAKPNSTLTTLLLNKAVTIKKPMEGTHFSYRIDVTKEDSIYWKADQPCAIALFNSSGEWVDKIGANDLLKGKTIKTPLKGSYYAVLHGAVQDATYNKEELTFICISKNLNDTIHVEVPGTLPNLVGDPDVLENLTLTGYLNGTDIKFIRNLPRLIRLDIGGAHIVEGGEAYYKNYRTADEITGTYMFYGLNKLIRLILSETTTGLEASALEGCSALTELSLPASILAMGSKALAGCNQLMVVNWNCNVPVQATIFDPPTQMGNCLVYAPADVACTYEGNVVIGGVAGRITLTHAKPFRCPEAFKAKEITYTRHFSMASGKGIAAGWETVVLPFTVQKFSHASKGTLAPFNSGQTDVKPFWLRKLTSEGFKDVTSLEANTPYIISMPNSDAYEEEFNIRGDVIFHAENADGVPVQSTRGASLIRTEGPEFTLAASYERTLKHDTVYAINLAVYNNIAIGGAFVKDVRDVSPFETYALTKQQAGHAPKFYSIEGGGTTGLDDMLLKQNKPFKAYTKENVLYIETDKAQSLSIYAVDGHTVRTVNVHEGINTITGLDAGVYLLEKTKIVIGN